MYQRIPCVVCEWRYGHFYVEVTGKMTKKLQVFFKFKLSVNADENFHLSLKKYYSNMTLTFFPLTM